MESRPGVQGSRTRVAIVVHEAHDGGGHGRVFAELIRGAHREFELIVVSSELGRDLQALVDWKRVRVPRRPFPLRFVLFFLLAGIRLARIRTDLVHTAGALVPNRADLASVHCCHAGYSEAAKGVVVRGPVVRRVNTAIARYLARIVELWFFGRGRARVLAAVSDAVARELRRHYPHQRVFVTPNGVRSERFRPDEQRRRALRNENDIGSKDVVALFLGGEWDRKGLDIAIEAMGHAKNLGAGPDWLWVVGKGDTDGFRRRASAQGVGERVRFFDFRREVEAFYAASDLFVLPSLYETFSLAAFEAAASGLPVVMTRVGGGPELIGDNEAGMLVDRSGEAVGRAFFELVSDPDRRRRMGEEARRRAGEYTWEASVRSVERLYRRLAENGPRPHHRVPGS